MKHILLEPRRAKHLSNKIISMIASDRTRSPENQSLLNDLLTKVGINPQDFSYAIENFWYDIKEYDDYYLFRRDTEIQRIVRKMIDNIELAINAKIIVFWYFDLVIKCILDCINYNYEKEVTNQFLLLATDEIKIYNRLYSLSYEEVSKMYDNTLYNDSFIILLSYICITDHHPQLTISFNKDPHFYLDFFNTFKCQDLEILMNGFIEPEKKIISRCYYIQVFHSFKHFDESVSGIIKKLQKRPLQLVSDRKLSFFEYISRSRVIAGAIEVFATQTLHLPNPPFSSLDEAFKKFQYAFNHIINSKKVFHSNIHGYAWGLTVYEYIFIHKHLIDEHEPKKAVLYITLLHESAHLYKWISPQGFIKTFSPSSDIIISRVNEHKAEDGWRFENILFPGLSGEIFSGTVNMLLEKDSWNQSLSEFTRKFKGLQEAGESSYEGSFLYRESKTTRLRCAVRNT